MDEMTTQRYIVTIEGDGLPDNMSKEIAMQLDDGFLYEQKAFRIHVTKAVEVNNLKGGKHGKNNSKKCS